MDIKTKTDEISLGDFLKGMFYFTGIIFFSTSTVLLFKSISALNALNSLV